MKYYWIIGGGQLQIPVIEEVRNLGLKVIISDLNKNCICSGLCDLFFEIDIFDVEKHIHQAKKLIESGIEIIGVIAAGIDAPITASSLSKSIGLPYVDIDLVKQIHNKNLFRNLLKKHGFRTPIFFEVNADNINDYSNLKKDMPYPFIIKNSNSSASRGTKIFYEADIDDEVLTLKKAMACSRSKIALVESLWLGTEHTVETIIDTNGVFYKCFITDRSFDYSSGTPIETGLIHPSRLNASIQTQMFELAESICKKINLNFGAAKFDMIVSADGEINVIEMTTRLSGGFDCQYLVPIATGKNVLKAALLVYMGKMIDPSLLLPKYNLVTISNSLWPERGILKKIHGLHKLSKIPGFEKIFFRYTEGDFIDDYTDCSKRFCFIINSGKTLEEALISFEQTRSSLRIEVQT